MARHRLVAAIRRTRAELEVQVAEGLLRSELYLETGHPDEAAEVLEEQRQRVVAFEGRVREALAAAAAEAEAEAVLSGAAGVEILHDDAPADHGPARLPELVAAALALVVSVALVGAWSDVRTDQALRASMRVEPTETAPDTGDTAPAAETRSPDEWHALLLGEQPAPAPDVAPDDIVTTRRPWIADPILERLSAELRARPDVMGELEGLVSTLVPTNAQTDPVWRRLLSEAVEVSPVAERPLNDVETAADWASEEPAKVGADDEPDGAPTASPPAAESGGSASAEDSSQPASGDGTSSEDVDGDRDDTLRSSDG